MQQLFTDIRDYLQDRFGNPFWLSTIFAWLIINWPILVTALFQSEFFNVRYILNYFNTNSSLRYIWAPLAFGLAYSVLSGVLKETLEGIAKSCRSIVAEKFASLGFYRSVSLESHNKKIQTLEKRLIRNEFRQSDLDNLRTDYESVSSELTSMKERAVKVDSILIEALTERSDMRMHFPHFNRQVRHWI